MLFGVILALVCGTALSAPWPHGETSRHQQMNPNPFGTSALTQGFLCDWCVVGVEDAQEQISMSKDQIYAILNRTAALCNYCPVRDQCINVFVVEVPAAIEELLAQSPTDVCTEAGLCNEGATLPGLVMSGLNSNVARDRVIKRMLKRASALQKNMIRMIMGPDYLCDACHDFLTTARELLLDNNTQYEVMTFLAPLCDYMPTEYQATCDEFVQSIPFLMSMMANDVLIDSTCNDLGLCNSTRKDPVVDPVVDTLPDIFSRLGLPDILGQGRNQFQFPGGNGQNPGFQFPGFGGRGDPDRNPFGIPGRTDPQTPLLGAPRPGHPSGNPRPRPETPYGKWLTSTKTRPEKPQRPYKPKPRPKPTPAPEPLIPDFNLEDIFGKNPGAGILDQVPDMPQIPNFQVPGLNINFPGFGNSQRRGGRFQRNVWKNPFGYLPDWVGEKINAGEKIQAEKIVPADRVIEYIPDAIPDGGITIPEVVTIAPEMGATTSEDCEVCKMAVVAVDAWLQDNAAELQRMVLKVVQPFCEVFPSPMKEDCSSDVAEFVQTFIQVLVSKLQPDQICKMVGVCDATVDVLPDAPLNPTMGAEVPANPTDWPMLP